MKKGANRKESTAKYMIGAGLSGCITECFVLPVDTLKARLMMDESRAGSFLKNIKTAASKLHKEGGFRSFFKGLSPGLHRQIVFASTRIGLYEPVLTFFIL